MFVTAAFILSSAALALYGVIPVRHSAHEELNEIHRKLHTAFCPHYLHLWPPNHRYLDGRQTYRGASVLSQNIDSSARKITFSMCLVNKGRKCPTRSKTWCVFFTFPRHAGIFFIRAVAWWDTLPSVKVNINHKFSSWPLLAPYFWLAFCSSELEKVSVS